ncbi:hypothetical protein [Mucilaginibacter segetis]|uniref:Uncharacterized protein n=1 Tax=Mucilaginibacter segetis TaxID=2793071 RepID=A0A934UNZ8_9SPHI|nr:hypothetical protein [Mucilaginibacter segetis]MBK0380620.1 hypothetical protein [Mucilaginibacter segetis]
MEFINDYTQNERGASFMFDRLFFQAQGRNEDVAEQEWDEDEQETADNDWDVEDEADEEFDDEAADRNDLHEIRVGDDVHEPNPEEDDHLPDDDLQ